MELCVIYNGFRSYGLSKLWVVGVGKLPLVRGFTSPRVHNSAGSLLRELLIDGSPTLGRIF